MSFTKELWINTDTRELVQGFLQALAETSVTFTQGDTVPLRVYLLKQLTNNQGRPFQNIQLTTETLKVALGRLDEKSTGGTFSLDFGGDDTTAILYNDTAANISTALNALASVTSAGGVTVTGEVSGPWTVTFVSVGARTSIVGDSTLVTPLSDLIITTITEGDGSTKEVQVIKLKESPVAVQTTFTIIADPTISVTEVIDGAAGINEIQKVKIDQVCQDGSFTLSFSSSSAVIEYAATAAQVVTALETTTGISSGDVAVQKISDVEYNITFQGALAGASQALIVADSSGLIGFSGFEADFEMGSYAVEQLLNGAVQNDEGFLEVELSMSGDRTTVLVVPAVVQNDLIDESVTAPPSNGTDWDALLAAKIDGPASAVDENIMIFDGITGKAAKDSGVQISDLGSPFTDANPLIKNAADATKLIGFDASAITTGTTRTVTMPDADVDLGALGDVSSSSGSSTDNNIATMDSTTGKLIQDSGVNISVVSSALQNIVEDTTPQLGGTLDTNSKQVRLSKGADVASAGSLTLGTDGNYFDITGTTTITSISTLAIGTEVTLHFDGIVTLNYHATDLVLPSAADVTTAAGDEFTFIEYATGDWRCISYALASGSAIVGGGGGGDTLIGTATISSSVASVDVAITDSSLYRRIRVEWDLETVANATYIKLFMKLMLNGTLYSANYASTAQAVNGSSDSGSNYTTAIILSSTVSNADTEQSGQMTINNIDGMERKGYGSFCGATGNGWVVGMNGFGYDGTDATEVVDEIQMYADTNLTGGEIRIYGVL